MDQPNKLKKFEDAVLSEIEMKTALMREEAEEMHKAEIAQTKDDQLAKAYAEIQKKIADLKKSSKREIAKYSLQAKRELLQKRNELMQSVFDGARRRIVEYCATEKYLTRMCEKLSEYAAECKLTDAEIFLCERDMKHSEKLSKSYGLSCTVLLDKKNLMGGFVIKSQVGACYFDETLETLLLTQKDYFIENSELALVAE